MIWLHGLGADGNDFAALVPELDLGDCPPIRFVFPPHAPSIPVTVNGGYIMPAWYDILGVNLVDRQDAEGIKKSDQAVLALIANEVTHGIPHERIVLAGFSQGCAMALHTGLRMAHRLGGIIALSGYLPALAGVRRRVCQCNAPIFMAHGTMDPVVVPARGEKSRDALVAVAARCSGTPTPCSMRCTRARFGHFHLSQAGSERFRPRHECEYPTALLELTSAPPTRPLR